jgi:hypothetical protein
VHSKTAIWLETIHETCTVRRAPAAFIASIKVGWKQQRARGERGTANKAQAKPVLLWREAQASLHTGLATTVRIQQIRGQQRDTGGPKTLDQSQKLLSHVTHGKWADRARCPHTGCLISAHMTSNRCALNAACRAGVTATTLCCVRAGKQEEAPAAISWDVRSHSTLIPRSRSQLLASPAHALGAW